MKWFNSKNTQVGDEVVAKEDLRYLSDLQTALHAEKHKALSYMLLFVGMFVLTFFIWAWWSKLEIVTRADGKVIPSKGDQIIQSLDPGVIEELLVKEGDTVQPGQLLVRIDPTRSEASYNETISKIQSLQGAAARLRAEATGTPLNFGVDVPAEVRARETAAFVSRKRAMEDTVAALRQSKRLLDREIAVTEPMVARGVMSEVELLRSKRQANDLAMQMVERKNRYQADADSELQRVEGELGQALENSAGRKDVLVRTEIKSPVKGTVKNIRNSTIGGVVGQGQEIMDIVPLDDQLLIEAYVKPKDVAGLHTDMNVLVKFTAYDFSTYGGLSGKLIYMSPDTVQDEQRRHSQLDFDPNSAVYKVLVKTDKSYLIDKKHLVNGQPKKLQIIPGMIVTADIITGERTVLQYIFKPLWKTKQALTEK